MQANTKNAEDENFPVASFFLEKRVRTQVMRFYKLARACDDIADSPDTLTAEKIKQLDEYQGIEPFLDALLIAFKQDAVKNRYENWAELIEYCRYSANPVGRFLLSAHDEDETSFEASDALCTVLQILNHLQDCQKDYHELDRIYLPEDLLPGGGLYEKMLSKSYASPELLNIIQVCLDEVDLLLKQATRLPLHIKSKRLRYQAKVTLGCAYALRDKLRKNDPLLKRVELTKWDKIKIAVKGMWG